MRATAKALLIGVLVSALIIAVAVALFILIWGWQRFLADFWPLDNSRIGPNFVASIVTIVLVTAHNEGRVVQKDRLDHDSLRTILDDVVQQAIHPAEAAEESIADAVNNDQAQGSRTDPG